MWSRYGNITRILHTGDGLRPDSERANSGIHGFRRFGPRRLTAPNVCFLTSSAEIRSSQIREKLPGSISSHLRALILLSRLSLDFH